MDAESARASSLKGSHLQVQCPARKSPIALYTEQGVRTLQRPPQDRRAGDLPQGQDRYK